MSEHIETLGTALPKEIERCQELLHIYADLGPVGAFGHAMIKQKLAAAHKAMIEGDCIGMIRALKALEACNKVLNEHRTMKKKLKLTLMLGVTVMLTGCASFHEKYKSQFWTPDSFNYTLQRDRETGDVSDYFGLSWQLK